jgi:hypothetical protein
MPGIAANERCARRSTECGLNGAAPALPGPHSPDIDGCTGSNPGRDSTQELDGLHVQQRAGAVCGPKILPRCVARNSTLYLHIRSTDYRDLDDHARRWLAGPNHLERDFGALHILADRLQQMADGHRARSCGQALRMWKLPLARDVQSGAAAPPALRRRSSASA